MTLKRLLQASVLAFVAWSAQGAKAETVTGSINGATCIPYPPFDPANAVPYQHWLYGFREAAFCHLPMADDLRVDNLSYVLFLGRVSSGSLSARLCVHSGTYSVTCGTPRTISAGGTVQWVSPPSPLPSSASGAFVWFSFPRGSVSTIQQILPAWTR